MKFLSAGTPFGLARYFSWRVKAADRTEKSSPCPRSFELVEQCLANRFGLVRAPLLSNLMLQGNQLWLFDIERHGYPGGISGMAVKFMFAAPLSRGQVWRSIGAKAGKATDDVSVLPALKLPGQRAGSPPGHASWISKPATKSTSPIFRKMALYAAQLGADLLRLACACRVNSSTAVGFPSSNLRKNRSGVRTLTSCERRITASKSRTFQVMRIEGAT